MNEAEINHLLELARLDLSEEEKDKIAHDLAAILSYVEQLQEVNTEGIEPMSGGTFLESVVREDEISSFPQKIQKEGYFQIPPIFE